MRQRGVQYVVQYVVWVDRLWVVRGACVRASTQGVWVRITCLIIVSETVGKCFFFASNGTGGGEEVRVAEELRWQRSRAQHDLRRAEH